MLDGRPLFGIRVSVEHVANAPLLETDPPGAGSAGIGESIDAGQELFVPANAPSPEYAPIPFSVRTVLFRVSSTGQPDCTSEKAACNGTGASNVLASWAPFKGSFPLTTR